MIVGFSAPNPHIIRMGLPDSSDDDEFHQQLLEVEAAARKLGAFFEPDETGIKDNQHLPEDFPVEQLCDIAAAMGRVSRSLPDKLERAMEHAKLRLGTIRNKHIPRNRELPYGRGSYVDDLVIGLVGELTSALDFFARGRDLPDKAVPEDDVVLEAEDRAEADQYTEQSLALSQALNVSIDEAERLVERLEENQIRELLYSLNTTEILNRLTRAELRHDPRPGWLDGLSEEMKDMPDRIDAAADAVDGLADVGQKLWDVIKDPGQGIVNLTRNLASGMRSFSRRLREQVPSTSEDSGAPPPFDLEQIKADLKRGIRPHSAHIPQITELDFFGEEDLSNLIAFDGLTALQRLDLRGTQVSDVSALSGLTALKALDLRETQVSHVSALSGLTELQLLGLSETQVNDVPPLSGLTALRALFLSETQVSDISALSNLTTLEGLFLRETQVSDVSALSGLTALATLYLTGAPVSEISELSGLTALATLHLGETRVSDISALSRLTALRKLDVRGTQVSDVSALSDLTSLKELDLSGTQVSDVSALAGLTSLKTLDLRGTSVDDVSPLDQLVQRGLRIIIKDEDYPESIDL